MCLAQGPQRSDAGEARTHGPSVMSQALYHWATALPWNLYQIAVCNQSIQSLYCRELTFFLKIFQKPWQNVKSYDLEFGGIL